MQKVKYIQVIEGLCNAPDAGYNIPSWSSLSTYLYKSPSFLFFGRGILFRLCIHYPQPLPIECIDEPVRQFIIDNPIGVMEIDTVVAIREDVDVVVLHLREVKLIQQRQRVLHVHIVICDTMHQQEPDVLRKRSDIVDGAAVVSSLVRLWSEHVSFGVDTVIEPPIRDGCDSHAVAERLASVLLKRLESVETTKGPTPDGEAGLVDVRFGSPDLGGSDLVVRFPVTQVATDEHPVLAADEARSATIDRDNEIAQVGGNVRLEVNGKLLGYLLRDGPAVLVEEHRILLLGVKVRGTAFDVVEVHAVYIDCAVDLNGQLVLLRTLGEVIVRFMVCSYLMGLLGVLMTFCQGIFGPR